MINSNSFFFTFHVFIFIFIRKVIFYCVTLCQVKLDRVYITKYITCHVILRLLFNLLKHEGPLAGHYFVNVRKMLFGPATVNLEQKDIFMYFLHKITAAQNEIALSYHRLRGVYFLAVIFAAPIIIISK